MTQDPALPNLTGEEHAELERRRVRYAELMTVTDPQVAAASKDEVRRVQARISELCEKGRARIIRG